MSIKYGSIHETPMPEPSSSKYSGRIHECYLCGKRAPWSDQWNSYGSILMEENHGILLKFCSDACRSKLDGLGGVEHVFDAECAAHGLKSNGKKLKR